MNYLIINKYGHMVVKESEIRPMVGDTVDLFYSPRPKVKAVVLWPTTESIEGWVGNELKSFEKGLLGIDNIDAVVLVE